MYICELLKENKNTPKFCWLPLSSQRLWALTSWTLSSPPLWVCTETSVFLILDFHHQHSHGKKKISFTTINQLDCYWCLGWSYINTRRSWKRGLNGLLWTSSCSSHFSAMCSFSEPFLSLRVIIFSILSRSLFKKNVFLWNCLCKLNFACETRLPWFLKWVKGDDIVTVYLSLISGMRLNFSFATHWNIWYYFLLRDKMPFNNSSYITISPVTSKNFCWVKNKGIAWWSSG